MKNKESPFSINKFIKFYTNVVVESMQENTRKNSKGVYRRTTASNYKLFI
ncbi:MAG: hypothetical protein WC223_11145 [Bacteroidales bacterium]